MNRWDSRIGQLRANASSLAVAAGILLALAAAPSAFGVTGAPHGGAPSVRAGNLPRAALVAAPRGLDPRLRGARGSVRVVIIARRAGLLGPVFRAALAVTRASTVSPASARRIVRDRGFARRLARHEERERERALALLRRNTLPAGKLLVRLARRIARLGGTTVAAHPLALTLTAIVPARSLRRLAREPLVLSIQPARTERPAVWAGSEAVGAPIWWAQGLFGQLATGAPADTNGSGPDLYIAGDRIDAEHPAYRRLLEAGRFLVPPGQSPICPAGVAIGGDPCKHGTMIVAMAVGQGCPTDHGAICQQASDQRQLGIAPGLDKLLMSGDEPPSGFNDQLFCGGRGLPPFNPASWALGEAVPFESNCGPGVWPIAADPAENASASYGGDAQVTDPDDDAFDQAHDIGIWSLSLFSAAAAGNLGASYDRGMRAKCKGFNEFCVGSFTPGANLADRSDDQVSDFSARGPTPGGRKKPDIVAVGQGFGGFPNPFWRSSGQPLYRGGDTGTSFSAPQAAGAAVLLHSVGVTDPLARKALLVNSAYKPPTLGCPQDAGAGRDAAGFSPIWGFWDPCWGWGALDLDRAWRERGNWASGWARPGKPAFYRVRLEGSDDRATVAWYRRGTYRPLPYLQGERTLYTLTDLDLEQITPTGVREQLSGSRIDNVEQVRAREGPFPRSAIYKVVARSTVEGQREERFAIAATRPLTPLVAPLPEISASRGRGGATTVGDGDTLSVTVRNPSDELQASGVSVEVVLPRHLVTSDPTRLQLGDLAPGEQVTFELAFRAVQEGSDPIRVYSRASALGEELNDERAVQATAQAPPPPPTPPSNSSDGPARGAGGASRAETPTPSPPGPPAPAGSTPRGRRLNPLLGKPAARLRGRAVSLAFTARTARGWRAHVSYRAGRSTVRRVMRLRCRRVRRGRVSCLGRMHLGDPVPARSRLAIKLARPGDRSYLPFARIIRIAAR